MVELLNRNRKKFILMDEIEYYLSQPDDKALIRLYVPAQLRKSVPVQHHDDNGHMRLEKTIHAIKHEYFWPSLLKDINDFVRKYISCQTWNLRKHQPHMQECDLPPFPLQSFL